MIHCARWIDAAATMLVSRVDFVLAGNRPVPVNPFKTWTVPSASFGGIPGFAIV